LAGTIPFEATRAEEVGGDVPTIGEPPDDADEASEG